MFLFRFNSYCSYNLICTPSNTNPDTQINLVWDSVTNAVCYGLYRNDGTGDILIKNIVVDIERDYLRYTDTGDSEKGLKPETIYTYTMKAFSDSAMQNEIFSTSNTATTSQMIKPNNLRASFDINNRAVIISWNNNSAALTGSIIKTSGGLSVASTEGAATTSSFIDVNLVDNIKSGYVVVSVDDNGHSSTYSDIIEITPISPPQITALMNNGVTDLSWGQYEYITNFELQRSKYNTTSWGDWTVINNQLAEGSTNTKDTPTQAGIYRYRLSAKTESGYEGAGNLSQPVSKPYAPNDLVCAFSSQNGVDLSWVNNAYNESVLLVEKKTGSGEYQTIASLPKSSTSYLDTFPVVSGADYYYRITAFETESNKVSSAEYKITASLPSSPTSLSLTLTSETETVLEWKDNSSNENGFKIERKTDSEDFVQIGTVTSNTDSYQDNTVTSGHQYTYRVLAFNYIGNSTITSEISSSGSIVSLPTALDIAVSSPTQVRLSWTYPTSLSYMTIIERKTGVQGTWNQIGSVNVGTLSYTDSTVSQNTSYFYRIKAKSNTNNVYSTYYPNTDGREAYTVYSVISLNIVSSSRIDVNWQDNVTGETGFKVQRKIDSGSFTDLATVLENKTVYTDNNVTTGHTYTYRVVLNSLTNSTVYTNEISTSISAIVNPTSLEVTSVSATQINLSWSLSAGGSHTTIIERKTGESGAWSKVATVTENTSYENTGLSENTQYFYRVKTYYTDNIYSGTYPNDNTGTGAYTKINKPVGFKGEAASDKQINLSWTSGSNGVSYIIERKTELGEYVEVGKTDVNVTAWSDVLLIQNTIYYYRIWAKTSYNISDYSDQISVTCTNLIPPSGLKASAISGTGIELSWNDNSSNESGFEVWRMVDNSTIWELVTGVEKNVRTYQDLYLTAGKQYSYKVRAYISEAAIYSLYSNSAATITTVPDPPTNLTFGKVSSTAIKLVWKDNSQNESGFIVEKKNETNDTWSEIASLSANITSYTITGLIDTQTYTYRIKAFNSVYNSVSYSNEVKVALITPGAPLNLNLEPFSASQIKIQWTDNSESEQGFKIERKIGNGSFGEIASVGQNATTYIDKNLASSTEYLYRVRAYNSSGFSAYSETKSVFTKASITYRDLDKYGWARIPIERLASMGIIKGKTKDKFYPGDKVTRAEFVSLVIRALKQSSITVGSFADVNGKDWFYKEVMTAKALGIINGNKDNYFYPNNPITRQDAAVIINRALMAVNKPLQGSSTDILSGFKDVETISKYALSSFASLYYEKIINGKTAQMLAPIDKTTRAEAAVLISKVIDR